MIVYATITWPQYTVIAFFILVTVGGVVRHGKPSTPINFMSVAWTVLWMALILGMGGFWKPLGW